MWMDQTDARHGRGLAGGTRGLGDLIGGIDRRSRDVPASQRGLAELLARAATDPAYHQCVEKCGGSDLLKKCQDCVKADHHHDQFCPDDCGCFQNCVQGRDVE